ncbi:MAG: DUF3368 domain-containing protein [Cyanobacteria bacterium P01_G01_bin.54]
MKVVSNTSPLVNLAVIGQLPLLQRIYPKILIPPTVHNELICFPPIQTAIAQQVDAGALKLQTPRNSALVQTLSQALDPGEAAAIALATELRAERLLIDERAGRRVSKQYGLNIRGIVGILVNAKQQGLILATKPLLDRLIQEAGFRMSPTLYESALKAANELN